jgi:hypothetical protein
MGAPTRGQAKQIFWQDLLDFIPAHLISGHPNRTDLSVRLTNGSEIHVVGMEAHERIQGVPWHIGGVSEYQECDRELFPRTLEPMFNDTRGQLFLEGRPIGKNHFYDAFNQHDSDPLWQSYTWPSADVLLPDQIEAAKRTLAVDDFAREYEASFETSGQLAYYAFNHSTHLRTIEPRGGAPVIVCCDFNATTKPMSWNICQEEGGITYVLRSLSFTHTHTETMLDKLDEELARLFGTVPAIIFYGDYAGKKHTSNSDKSDWQMIGDHYKHLGGRYEERTKSCRSIRGRVAALNARLCNAAGEVKMYIDPSCKALIRDFERVGWKSNGMELDDQKDDLLTHTSDALSYYADYEFPIRPDINYVRA